jgi:hypothetical protein
MCLVRAWKTGLEDRQVAPVLSHYKMGGLEKHNPISEHNNGIHDSSAIVLVSALYSASVFEHAIVCFLRQLYERKLSPRKIQ